MGQLATPLSAFGAVPSESAEGADFKRKLFKGANMNDQNSRMIPPGQFGSPFFEPSLSMGAPESGVLVRTPRGFDVSGSMNGGNTPTLDLDRFFEMGAKGGTDISAALSAVFDAMPRDKRWDRYQLVITDGDAFDGDEEARKSSVAAMLAGLNGAELNFVGIGVGDTGLVPDVVFGPSVKPVQSVGDVIAKLVASLKPGEQLVCLDYSGAQPPFPGEDAPRVIASRPADDEKSS